MVIFFFVVGLEVRHELDCGELSSLRRSGLPVIAAALGGMVLPAATYAAFNWGGENLAGRVGSLSAGWALACRNPLFRPVLRAGLAQIGGWNVEEVRRTIQPVGDAYVEDAASPAGRGRHCPHPLILVWMAVFCCAVALSADAVPEREVSGVRMPEVVSVAGRELHLNGIGLRKVYIFFKVYVVGLYLEKPTTDARTAITTDEAKRIVLVMLRDVSRKKFVQSVEEGILRNSGPAMPALRTRLDRLEKALPDLKKGNVLDFTYLPGAGTLVRGQGREMTIPGKDFADALFSVWLGPNPTSEDLKRQLLSGPPSAPATDSIGHMRMPAPRGAIPRKGSPLGSAERASRGLDRARSSASFVPPRWERGRADSDLRARLRCRLRCRDPGDSG